MVQSKICLCLTAKTLSENLETVNKYRDWVDILELRVDCLTRDERLHIRRFPEMAGLPTILTIRRKIDGGFFIEGEAARTTLFARGLAYADSDFRKNFAYIDLESDFNVPSLHDASIAFGTKVIRSIHSMDGPVTGLAEKIAGLRTTGYEIPKIAFMPRNLSDVTNLFNEAKEIKGGDHILIAMGPYGLPSRILASRLGSYLTFCSPPEALERVSFLGHIDPITLQEVYRFKSIDDKTQVFGITGYPLSYSRSPAIHNGFYQRDKVNAVYIPVRTQIVEKALQFAEEIGMGGLSVTVPYKEDVLEHLDALSAVTGEIGACNTVVRRGGLWRGYNTDGPGLMDALRSFTGAKNLRRWRVSIIGAGGAARAAAYAVHELRGKACILNRTPGRAKAIAQMYGFKWAALDEKCQEIIDGFSDLIIQTTSVGMNINSDEKDGDPIGSYDFRGHEMVYDCIYVPEKTPLLLRAEKAGCKIANGMSMLESQAEYQNDLFSGNYENYSGMIEQKGAKI